MDRRRSLHPALSRRGWSAYPYRKALVVSVLWIVIVVILVLALCGYFGFR